jgi:YD repeat-containing protein
MDSFDTSRRDWLSAMLLALFGWLLTSKRPAEGSVDLSGSAEDTRGSQGVRHYFDNEGRIVATIVEPHRIESTTYTYDAAGRLLSVETCSR